MFGFFSNLVRLGEKGHKLKEILNRDCTILNRLRIYPVGIGDSYYWSILMTANYLSNADN